MKQNSIESLLEKYREGTLSETERAELEQLTHKDEVTAAACRQATGIVRRRLALAVSVLMIGGAGVWSVLPQSQGEELIAEARMETEEYMPDNVKPVMVAPTPAPPCREGMKEESGAASSGSSRQTGEGKMEESRTASAVPSLQGGAGVKPKTYSAGVRHTPKKKAIAEPVVVCNNQCDADSVINDIKKFLSV